VVEKKVAPPSMTRVNKRAISCIGIGFGGVK